MKKISQLAILGSILISPVSFADTCAGAVTDSNHQAITQTFCQYSSSLTIAGITDNGRVPIRDKMVVSNIQPAGAIAYITFTPNAPLDLQAGSSESGMTFTLPVSEGQCVNLVSNIPHGALDLSFDMMLDWGDTNAATQATVTFAPNSHC